MAERVGRRHLCRSSALRGIGGLGDGAEGRAQRVVLHADVGGLPGLRAATGFHSVAIWPCSLASSSGLAAKPMAVTLPFLLLLLDYWPLGRMHDPEPRSSPVPDVPARFSVPMRLILEKVPMLAIACLFCLLTVHGQEAAALEVNQQYSFAWRIGNALISYVAYLGQFFCPLGLAPCYPRRALLAALAGGRGGSDPGLHHGGGDAVAAAAPVPAGRLALVRRDARARHWPGAVWRPGRGRSVQLPAADRTVHCLGVGSSGGMPSRAAISTKLGCRRCAGIGDFVGLCLAADVVLARQRSALESLFGLHVEQPGLHVNLGRHFYVTGRPGEAAVQYRKTLAIDPKCLRALCSLGGAYFTLGQLDKAEEFSRRALAVDPNDPGSYTNLGMVLTERGQYGEAVKHFQQALAVSPDYVLAHSNLARVLSRMGQFDEAFEQYRESLRLQPDDPKVHNNFGNALRARGRLDEAIQNSRNRFGLKPNSAAVQFNLALSLTDKKRLPAAELHYRLAIALDPNLVQPHVQLGRLLAGQGRWDEATAHYQQVVQLAPQFLEPRLDLAAAQAAHGDFRAAIVQWKTILQVKPDSAEAMIGLADLLATCLAPQFRDGPSALEFARRADRLCGGKSPEVLRSLSAAQAEMGQFSEAAATARAALELAEQQHKESLAASLKSDIGHFVAGQPRRWP